MKKCGKQIFSFLLIFIMLFALLPTEVFAEDKPLYNISEKLYYGREALSKMENGENLVAAYDAIGAAVKSGQTRIELNDYNITYSKEMARLLLSTYNSDHPEDYKFPKSYRFNSISKNNKIYIQDIFLEYYTDFNDSLFKRMAQRLLDAVGDKTTEYEKALALYNMLQEYVEYDNDALNAYGPNAEILDNEGIKAYNAYGAIVNGKAVCEGYAEAYQYLLQRLGIQSYIVTGKSLEGVNHEWNLLRVDGKYYYADVTWDDYDNSLKHFHSYFNITTARLLEEHTLDDPYSILPYCVNTEHTYNNYDNVLSSFDIDEIVKSFKGDQKKTADIYYTGEEFDLNEWWAKNSEEFGQKVATLVVKGACSISVVPKGREYIFEAKPAGYGATVGGTLLCWGETAEATKIEVFKAGSNTSIYTTYLNGNFNFWTLDGVKDGSYKLKVSKAEHKAKEYTFDVVGEDVILDSSLFLLGDVTEDGIIDIRDFARTKVLFASGKAGYNCDVDENGAVDAYDLIAIAEKIL